MLGNPPPPKKKKKRKEKKNIYEVGWCHDYDGNTESPGMGEELNNIAKCTLLLHAPHTTLSGNWYNAINVSHATWSEHTSPSVDVTYVNYIVDQ